jgi:hypothetical protein
VLHDGPSVWLAARSSGDSETPNFAIKNVKGWSIRRLAYAVTPPLTLRVRLINLPGARTFKDACCISAADTHIRVSNFDLINKPAGLCPDHLACAFDKCDAKGINLLATAGMSCASVARSLGARNLPALITFPESVADVISAIAQATTAPARHLGQIDRPQLHGLFDVPRYTAA